MIFLMYYYKNVFLIYHRLDAEYKSGLNSITNGTMNSYSPNNIKNFEETNPFRNNSSHHGSFGKASIASGLRLEIII